MYFTPNICAFSTEAHVMTNIDSFHIGLIQHRFNKIFLELYDASKTTGEDSSTKNSAKVML